MAGCWQNPSWHVSSARTSTSSAPLAVATGAVFRADPGTFSVDRFHPSADGYRLLAEALLPAVTEAAAERAPL